MQDIEFVELRIRGRNYETAILDWDQAGSRFMCKTYRQPEYCGWLAKVDLEAAMVKNDHTHRCCNVHGQRLTLGAAKETNGRTFMECPSCDVGLWVNSAGSSSLPAPAELRLMRSKVFEAVRADKDGVLKIAIDSGMLKDREYLAIGMLNMDECLTLLGLAKAQSLAEELPIAEVRRRLVLPVRAVELD
jgi:hypothetical protein